MKKTELQRMRIHNSTIDLNKQEKTLDVISINDAEAKVNDIKVFGDGDTFKLLCKASSDSQGWMKSTKVCNLPNGCLVQVSTQQRNPDGSYSVAEALTFVPDVKMKQFLDENPFLGEIFKPELPQGVTTIVSSLEK